MSEYKIYANSLGDVKAVKQGWCWLGFFFNIGWALYNQMWKKAALSALYVFILTVIAVQINWSGLMFGALFWLYVDYGYKGNTVYKDKHFLSKGYTFKTTISAASADGAAALYSSAQLNSMPT